MGMIEEARVNLAEGISGDSDALLAANAQASIAMAESLYDVQDLLTQLIAKVDQVDSGVMRIANKD